jgi:hypothetical protein
MSKRSPPPALAITAPPRTEIELTGPRRELFADITRKWKLEGPDLALLQAALQSLERAARFAAIVDAGEAMISDGRGGLKAHPGINAERDARSIGTRILHQLACRLEGGD